MRRGELLWVSPLRDAYLGHRLRRSPQDNTTWRNIDFDKQTIDVSPKKDSDQTWEWLAKGLPEYDVMNLAGHATFETTRRFYLAVREDLLQRAQTASAEAMNSGFVAHLLRAPFRD